MLLIVISTGTRVQVKIIILYNYMVSGLKKYKSNYWGILKSFWPEIKLNLTYCQHVHWHIHAHAQKTYSVHVHALMYMPM